MGLDVNFVLDGHESRPSVRQDLQTAAELTTELMQVELQRDWGINTSRSVRPNEIVLGLAGDGAGSGDAARARVQGNLDAMVENGDITSREAADHMSAWEDARNFLIEWIGGSEDRTVHVDTKDEAGGPLWGPETDPGGWAGIGGGDIYMNPFVWFARDVDGYWERSFDGTSAGRNRTGPTALLGLHEPQHSYGMGCIATGEARCTGADEAAMIAWENRAMRGIPEMSQRADHNNIMTRDQRGQPRETVPMTPPTDNVQLGTRNQVHDGQDWGRKDPPAN